MDPAEFVSALEKLKLPQAQFAALMGMEKGTINRWAMGKAAVPIPMAILIRLMVLGLVKPGHVRKARSPASS
jgi:DNA-binding transcriptional regulator YiaG